MAQYSVIIPVVYKDYSFLKTVVKYICVNLQPEHIYILTNGKMARYLPKEVVSNSLCHIVDEDRLIPRLSYQKLNQIIKSQGRQHTNTGWFYQQFLKMGFSLSDFCSTDYYLSWDADTLPLQKIDFFDKDGHPFFTMKTEFHKPYFIAIKTLLGLDKTNTGSYIAEHMMFNREIMKEMLLKIEESSVSGDNWVEKIMNAIVPETISAASFSEFETYGTYCMNNYPNLYLERELRNFRLGGIIQGRFISERLLAKLATEMAIVSFEIYDRPPHPWWLICECYERYRHYKEVLLYRFI